MFDNIKNKIANAFIEKVPENVRTMAETKTKELMPYVIAGAVGGLVTAAILKVPPRHHKIVEPNVLYIKVL